MKVNLEIVLSGKNESFTAKHYNELDFESPRHYHEEFELIFIESTSGKLFVGNEIVEYSSRSLYLFAPNLVHSFKNAKGKTRAKADIILFKKDFLGKEFLNRNEAVLLKKMLDESNYGLLISSSAPKIIRMIKNVISKSGMDALIDFLSLLHQISTDNSYKRLNRIVGNKSYYRLNDEYLSSIFTFVEQHYAERNIYKMLLKKNKKSNASFSRNFKNRTGKTFTQYLNEYRILQVQKKMIENDTNILDIACSCGYQNQVYFNRIFKKLNGVTPKQYRKSLRTD